MSDRSNREDRGGEDLFGSLPMKPSYTTVRSMDWQSVLPWTLIFRTVPMAAGVSVVSLGTLGVVLSWIGWSLGGYLFGIDAERLEALPHLAAIESQHESVVAPAVTLPKDRKLSELPRDGVSKVIGYYWSPAVGILRVPAERGLLTFLYLLWGLLWTLAVWSWLGGAIARIAVVRLGRDEGIGLKSALTFATRRFLAFFAPPLYPLALLLVLALLGVLPGLLARLDWGASLVSLFWFVGIAVSMVFTIVILGVLVGWPLMVVTTAAEGTDSLDGLARGFAYSFQRPINYAMYLIVSIVFSILCVAVAALVANLVLDLTYWSMSWGAGGERIAELRPHLDPDFNALKMDVPPAETEALSSPSSADEAPTGEAGSNLKFAQRTFQFWDGLLGLLLNGFAFGLFWCLYSAIYLLLRRDVDETEVDEVFIDEDEHALPQVVPHPASDSQTQDDASPAPKSAGETGHPQSTSAGGTSTQLASDATEQSNPDTQSESSSSAETDDPVPDHDDSEGSQPKESAEAESDETPESDKKDQRES